MSSHCMNKASLSVPLRVPAERVIWALNPAKRIIDGSFSEKSHFISLQV
jgi:hypothetical protein